ncbi:DUF4382 domain-containing protein [Variovorax sp. PCZ-1]|uniref:DUF4382 domain-containing protein n=1 Tax=Variovorax sp. PCZ-1 TaxID=2835533 RepID=UPI001BCD085B|nr:DUF4382 domain-containing protein [Variovorax sp. PCZ-1]
MASFLVACGGGGTGAVGGIVGGAGVTSGDVSGVEDGGVNTSVGGVGGGSGGTGAPSGSLSVGLTDAPACGYNHVYVTVEKVRVNLSDTASDADAGWSEIALPAPKRIDLLTLTNGVVEPLGSTNLPAGKYRQLRLVLASNTTANPFANAVVPTGGSQVALDTPSAQQSGLKLKTDFDVAASQQTNMVIDFDACKSVVKAGNSGKYQLKPVLSVFKRGNTGIEGYVALPLANSNTIVSAQQNGVSIRSTVPNTSGQFILSFLPAGTYTLVINSTGYSTGVITGIPVATAAGNTTVSSSASPFALGASSMSAVSGTVTLAGAPATTATIGITQVLTSAGTVSLAQLSVDSVSATYGISLPRLAPQLGVYSTTTKPALLSADNAAAGNYRITAQALGSTQVAPVNVSSGDVSQGFVFP